MQLYYLQSRYYDSSIGRFINADGFITTGQGVLSYNMFAYCGNNPIIYSDPSGHVALLTVLKCIAKAAVFLYSVYSFVKPLYDLMSVPKNVNNFKKEYAKDVVDTYNDKKNGTSSSTPKTNKFYDKNLEKITGKSYNERINYACEKYGDIINDLSDGMSWEDMGKVTNSEGVTKQDEFVDSIISWDNDMYHSIDIYTRKKGYDTGVKISSKRKLPSY